MGLKNGEGVALKKCSKSTENPPPDCLFSVGWENIHERKKDPLKRG